MTDPTLLAVKKAIHDNALDQYFSFELIVVLKAADDLYYNDEESFLTDLEYDILRRFAEQLEPHNVYFTGVGSSVRGGKVKLPYQMGSLDQIYEGEITDWVGKWNLQSENMILTDKLDGTSALLVYDEQGKFQIGYSRGDGIQGQILSSHINSIDTVPKKISKRSKIKSVRGELIISKDNWVVMQQIARTKSNTLYRNARNCIAGLMNTIKVHPKEVYDLIDFVAYEIKEYYEENC